MHTLTHEAKVLRGIEMPLGKKLSYEEESTIKIVLVFSVIFLSTLAVILYPLLHRETVFEVSSPNGQPLLAKNVTIDGVSYKNVVLLGSYYNDLILRSSELKARNITITVNTAGWCMDLWVWGGMSEGWILKNNCTNSLSISYYSFDQKAAYESGELYMSLGGGTILVFHKKGTVRNYERVTFTVEYLNMKDVGAFLVSLGKR